MQRVLILVGLAAGCGGAGSETRGALAVSTSVGASSSGSEPTVRDGLCGPAGICDLPASCEIFLAELPGL